MVDRTTSASVDYKVGPTGATVTIIRYSGDVTSASKAAVLGTYQQLPPDSKFIVLDFTAVEYLNSSGVSLVIQMVMQAMRNGQTIRAFGLTPHFQKVFTMVGLTKYTQLYADEETACAAFFS